MTRRRRQGRDGQDRVAELEPLSAQLSTIRFGRADGLPWGCRPEGGFLDEVTARRMLRHADVIGAKTVPAGQAHARSSPAG